MVGVAILLLIVLNILLIINIQKTDKELDTLTYETQMFLNDIDKRLKALEREIKK